MKLLALDIGKIAPPPGTIPYLNVAADPSNFIAGFIRNGVRLLIIVAFVVFLIWTIFAGFRFVFSGGDEKSISGAWSQIYWGLLGMAIIIGSFAIIKLVETFFGVTVISGPFNIPGGS